MSKLCDYGCGNLANHVTKGSLKSGPFGGKPVHQCSKSANSCPAVKQKKVETSREKFGTDYPWQRKEILEKKVKSNIEKYGHSCCLLNPEVRQKRKKTMIEKYGVEEPTLNKEIRSKAALGLKTTHQNDPTIRQQMINTRKEKYGSDYASIIQKRRKTRIENGDWVDSSDIRLWENYKRQVKYHTYKNYNKYKDLLNPKNFPIGRLEFHIDHILSRKEGFDKKIDPKIISHPANLRVIDAKTNRRKYVTSKQTLEELLEKIKLWPET